MKEEKSKINIPRLIVRIVILLVILLILLFVIKIAPNYTKGEFEGITNLVINNNNITRNVKSEIIIEDDGKTVYLGTDDVKNFFDEYLLIDEENSMEL
mgnify:FL=1